MANLLYCGVTLVFESGVHYTLTSKLPLDQERARDIRAQFVQRSMCDDILPFLGMRPPELYDQAVVNVIFTHDGEEVFPVTVEELFCFLKIIVEAEEVSPRADLVNVPVGTFSNMRFNDMGYDGCKRTMRLLAADLFQGNGREPVAEYIFRADTLENFEEDFRSFLAGKIGAALFSFDERIRRKKRVHACIAQPFYAHRWYNENQFFAGVNVNPTRELVRL
jgi:hypothetical protein